MGKKNLMICENSSKAMKLNESKDKSGKYILVGTFATLNKKNRNDRIYKTDEYLRHLQYLRDDLKRGEPLLGELDHPEDRFEVKLKEASHRILDIWYDKENDCIMGKIELLNTPNGKLAQSLVEQGVPLHISSRAAGTVNPDGTVSIQQIYTYDLVAKPGFADAVLHRVNESENSSNKYTDDVNKYFVSSEKYSKKNVASNYGFVNEEVSILETNASAKFRSEAKLIQENNITDNNMGKNINESVLDLNSLIDNYNYVVKIAPERIDRSLLARLVNDSNTSSNKVLILDNGVYYFAYNDDDNFSFTDEDGVEYIKGREVESLNEKDEDKDEEDNKEEEKEDNADDNNSDDEKSEDGVEILDVRMVTAKDEENDDVEILDVDSDEDNDKDEDEEKESDDEKEDEDKTDECDKSEKCEDGNCDKDDEHAKHDPKKEMLTDCEDLKTRKNDFTDKLDDLIDSIKKKKERNEASESAIINKYPISALLNKKNFKEFMNIDESQKSKVVAYLKDNGKISQKAVNENWKIGLEYNVNEEIWLQYAPKNYKELFEDASEDVKKSIRNTASYMLFENMNDVNKFWESTGLMDKSERQLLNENFINNMPKITEENKTVNLPYGSDFINTVTQMACGYNQ